MCSSDLDMGLKDQADLKSHFDVRTELQVYRRIRKVDTKVIAKYVIPSGTSSKKGMARYLTTYDISPLKAQLAKEVIRNSKNKND